MKIWTNAPAIKKGFYKLKHKDGTTDVGRFDDELHIWKLTGINGCIASEHMSEQGYERSVEPLDLCSRINYEESIMIRLQYFNGKEWVEAGQFYTEKSAWISLGGDDENYRTLDEKGDILTSKLKGESNA